MSMLVILSDIFYTVVVLQLCCILKCLSGLSGVKFDRFLTVTDWLFTLCSTAIMANNYIYYTRYQQRYLTAKKEYWVVA